MSRHTGPRERGLIPLKTIERKRIACNTFKLWEPVQSQEQIQGLYLSLEEGSPIRPTCRRKKSTWWSLMGKTILYTLRIGCSRESGYICEENIWKSADLSHRLYMGAILAYVCLCSTFTSSIFSASTFSVAAHFGVSPEVATLSTSLYVLGYAFGPLIWGPFSELRGKRTSRCIQRNTEHS